MEGLQAALFELPLVAAASVTTAAALGKSNAPGTRYIAACSLPTAVAALLGAARFALRVSDASLLSVVHVIVVRILQLFGQWGVLFGGVSLICRQAVPAPFAFLAVLVSLVSARTTPKLVAAPVFVGTALCALPAYWAGDAQRQQIGRALLLCVIAYGLGAAVRGQPLSPPEPIGVGPLTNVDAFHVALAAAQACLGRAIDEARAPRARAKRA